MKVTFALGSVRGVMPWGSVVEMGHCSSWELIINSFNRFSFVQHFYLGIGYNLESVIQIGL